jgi:hypothetical protein
VGSITTTGALPDARTEIVAITAGVVVGAGSSDAAQPLLGKVVAAIGGAMSCSSAGVKVEQRTVLPAGTTPAKGI